MTQPPVSTEQLSDEQLAGQRLMVGFDGTGFDADLAYLIDTMKVGGIILFSRNVASPGQLRELTRACQAHARAAGQPLLFVAVDQEGGPVARLHAPFTEFEGNARMSGDEDARRFARITAEELRSVGINMNLAPVMDLAPEGIDSIMAGRSFGPDPERVARMGTLVIRQLQTAGVMAVAKHFPGIGRTTLDSHVDMPVLDAPADLLEATDLHPFRAAVECGVSGIMFSHIRYPAFDPDWPASLSSTIADGLLRRRMGFGGLTLTDDLDMGAITRHIDLSTAVSRLLAAKVDLCLVCHRSPNIEAAYEQILGAIRGSGGQRRAGEQSAERILAMKRRYGIGQEAGRPGGG